MLREAHVVAQICVDLTELMAEIDRGADAVVLTEEAVRSSNPRALHAWVAVQPAWSDFPFIVLTRHGGGLERNPAAALLTRTLGNVSFLERPFHPATLVSVVGTALRGRRRQHSAGGLMKSSSYAYRKELPSWRRPTGSC